MPQKGDKSTDCQRVYLQQQINEVYYAINGITEEDLNQNKDDTKRKSKRIIL